MFGPILQIGGNRMMLDGAGKILLLIKVKVKLRVANKGIPLETSN